MYNKNKAGISPVVATALLLVVAVTAVVFFQGWFKSFSSNMFSDVEMKSQSTGALSIEGLISTVLYVKNGVIDNLSMSSINIGDTVCNITGQEDLKLGMNEIDISSCITGISENVQDIVLITNVKVIDKTVYINNIDNVIDEIILSTSLICNTDADGDGQILWSCAQYPMTSTTYEGSLDVNDLNVTIIDDKCWLKGDKSSCESNFVVDGCGTGTVMDLGAGLCWQRNMSTAGLMNWTNAKTYCSGLTLAGQTWSLPTKEELMTLTDLSRSNPAIVGGNNNKFTNVVSDFYWTVSAYGPSPGVSAWRVTFDNGGDVGNVKTNPNHVICVVR